MAIWEEKNENPKDFPLSLPSDILDNTYIPADPLQFVFCIKHQHDNQGT